MGRVSRRKRISRRKTGRRVVSHKRNTVECGADFEDVVNFDDDVSEQRSGKTEPSKSLGSSASVDHDYGQSPPNCFAGTEDQTVHCEGPENSCFESEQVPLQDLLFQVKQKVKPFLPNRWMVIVDQDKLHVVFVSVKESACIQRSLIFHPGGNVEVFVHCRNVNSDPYTVNLDPPMPLSANTVNNYVDRIVSVVKNVWKMAVCSGYDEMGYQAAWTTCPFGEVDKNAFQECRYVETFRSLSCKMLVPSRKWRCTECQKLYAPLRRRTQAAAAEERHRNTGNAFLTEEQRLKKLQDLRTEADNLKKKNYRLHERMQEVIEKESIPIDCSLADDLSEIMSKSAISPAQSVFLQQQIKASQQKNASGMRWHPTMVRFALALHLTSPTAYELVRQTGMIHLPSSRTLFDYSTITPVEEGVDKFVLESLESRVSKFSEKHKKYHILMADKMHISQNLVFQKSSGRLVGYTSLDIIDREVKHLENWIDATEAIEVEETIASKVLVFMIKGVSNGIKEVVASYAVGNLSANQLKDWTWHVIGDLEKHGIAVVAFVSDGCAVNRAFIRKHQPATIHESGVIFDTWNRAARGRKLFFIADVPHLLKTIRNCFLNSRWDNKKSRRKMMINGKKISWDYVIKLYELKKGKSLRKSFKLNAQNVYPDSYARMRVYLAGQVLSSSVSKDMASQGWNDAMETVLFIERVNNWFDCLNGAHTTQGKRKKNENLNPYTSKEDKRFSLLENFLKFLDDWQKEAENANNTTVIADSSMHVDSPDCDASDIENAVFNPETDTPASKRLLSRETLEGTRITTLAFQPLIHFLLDEGVTFINARIFTQDPLEQHFSKVRAGQGGSNNPNVAQVLNRNRTLHTIGQLGMRKGKGNSGQEAKVVEVTSEPLAKRQCRRIPKFSEIKE